MFRKPFRVKSNTQMKGTDRKKLKLELERNFPTLSDDDLKNILPTKDDLSLVKVITHSGEVAQFYCSDKHPILFTLADKLYPTLYSLWKCPKMLPFFTTFPEVLPVLQGGADLMVAGIVTENNEYPKERFNKFDLVYVNLANNKAAVGIGYCALSSHDMYMSAGRGKCVLILHVYGDELCKFGALLPLPEYGSPFAKVEEQTLAEITPDDTLIENLKIEDTVEQETPCPASSTEDDVVLYCFLKALNMSVRNVKLPLLVSNFYKLHMIPACPEGKTLNIKKSRYKKVSNLVDEMAAERVIDIEESSPGVTSIRNVNYSHQLLSGFCDDQPNVSSKNDSVSQPQVCEKYAVTAAVLPLFSEFLIKKGESMTVSEARKYVAEYIKKYRLPLAEDPSTVKLDTVLKNIFAQGSNSEIPDHAKWEEVMNRVLYKMGRSFKITSNTNAMFSPKEQKGKLPMIDIRIANKMGNKKVTLVNNLEAYGINIDEFSRECQRGVAASATINQLAGSKMSQLQIQGNQINFIEKILTSKYNIPKKYMNGLQFAPKKK